MRRTFAAVAWAVFLVGAFAAAQEESAVEVPPPELTGLKAEVVQIVDSKKS
jgi:hypothetical protein